MFKFFVLIGLASIINARRVIYYHERIVNGFKIDIETAPYQVAIFYNSMFTCGGSIITENYILTAAHCIKKNIYIQAGSSVLKQGGSYHEAISMIIHENYDPVKVHNDIALIKVSPEILFDKDRQPIGLGSNLDLSEGALTFVTGWGSVEEGGLISRYLQAVYLPLIGNKECQRIFEGFAEILEGQLCAGFSEGGKDACAGDSGGPMVFDGYLVGVVSWGVGCARPIPGVYTKVAFYIDWIKNNIN